MSDKIGIYEFNLMPLDLRMETLHSWGRFLTNHFDGDTRFNLYQINDFYVEIEYSSRKNMITEVHTFKRGERLDKYLGEIDVEGLM